ncbi:MAG: serine/threonine-protein kinase, partial [Dokdonella sp.]
MADEVRALLMADEGVNTILDANAASSVPGILTDLDSVPGDGLVGPYRLLRSIGIGGMGEVWLAERTDGAYEQHVAVKLLKRGMDSNLILRRFLQERQILARLHHNHIVRLVDGGMSSEGRPFYVMDFVDGQPITDYAAAHALDVRARVILLASVADAVAYAHSQLIVHRDLKPSNVLVNLDGEPRVLDFGIAKLIEETDDATMTGIGMRVLSPAYAAPEQILGEPVGTATDVYALGLMLCELLTGQLPPQRQTTSLPQLAADVSQHVMDRASVLARNATAARIAELYGKGTAPKQIAAQVSRDLDLIIATALQREPARRYQTASAFADDLRRSLDGRPISARADSTTYRFNRFVRRHRVGVAAPALIAVSLIAGMSAAMYQAGKAREQATVAQQQAARAERVKAFLVQIFQQNDPSIAQGEELSAAEILRRGQASLDTSLVDDPQTRGELLVTIAEIQGKLAQFNDALASVQKGIPLLQAQAATGAALLAYGYIVRGEIYASTDLVPAAESDLRKARDILRDS